LHASGVSGGYFKNSNSWAIILVSWISTFEVVFSNIWFINHLCREDWYVGREGSKEFYRDLKQQFKEN
jgi:hypothetical protein